MFQFWPRVEKGFRYWLLATLILAVLFSISIYSYWRSETQNTARAFLQAEIQAKTATRNIDKEFSEFMKAVDLLADDLSAGKLTDQDITQRLQKDLKGNPGLFGLGTIFKPYQYRSDLRLFAPYFVWNSEGLALQDRQVDKVYDYTIPRGSNPKLPMTDWYILPIENNTSMWTDPFFGTASRNLLSVYAVPFYAPNKSHSSLNLRGVVIGTVSLTKLDQMMAAMQLGDTGYSYIISQEGTVIAHPVKELLGQKERFLEGYNSNQGLQRKDHSLTSAWHFVFPLSSTHWSVGINLNPADFSTPAKVKLFFTSLIVLLGLLTAISLSALLLKVYQLTTVRLWLFSTVSSLLLMLAIALLWHFHLSLANPSIGTKISDKATLNRYLALRTDSLSTYTYIPTGIFINNIYLPATNRIGVSGYLWQKFPVGTIVKQDPSFLFPQQSGFTSLREVARKTIQDQLIIAWHFDATLRQIINPVLYPVEKINIGIGLTSNQFMSNTMLVPDLDSYEDLSSLSLPGVNKKLYLESWGIEDSFFSYREAQQNLTFDKVTHLSLSSPLELYFNVTIAQFMGNAFFMYVLPLFFVITLLFVILLSTDIGNLIAYSGAMLIVLTVAEASMRDRIAIQGVCYLELFYIVMYPLMVFFVVCGLLSKMKLKLRFLGFRNGLIPKLLFWPLILALDFILSLIFLNLY